MSIIIMMINMSLRPLSDLEFSGHDVQGPSCRLQIAFCPPRLFSQVVCCTVQYHCILRAAAFGRDLESLVW